MSRPIPTTLTTSTDGADVADYITGVTEKAIAGSGDTTVRIISTPTVLDAILDLDEVSASAGVTGFSRVLTAVSLVQLCHAYTYCNVDTGYRCADDVPHIDITTLGSAAGAAVGHIARRVVDTTTDLQRQAWASIDITRTTRDADLSAEAVTSIELAAAAQTRLAVTAA